jgi:predicted S18 family serine protease
MRGSLEREVVSHKNKQLKAIDIVKYKKAAKYFTSKRMRDLVVAQNSQVLQQRSAALERLLKGVWMNGVVSTQLKKEL